MLRTIQDMDTDSQLVEERPLPEYLSNGSCNGVMGVPITYLFHHCPEQFEIVGLAPERLSESESTLQIKRYVNAIQHKKDGTTCSGNKVNDGPTILHHKQPEKYPYYTSETVEGKFIEVLYARILIRKRRQ